MKYINTWIVLFVPAIFTTATGQSYFFSNEHVHSSETTSVCKLAMPPIRFSKYEQEVDLANRTIEPITESMWVGFVLTNSTFLYKGCTNGDLLKSRSLTVDIQADPGKCYSFCKTRYIGIQRGGTGKRVECHCLVNLPKDLFSTRCTETCTFPEDTLCGDGTDASIYEKVSEPVSQVSPFPGSDMDGRCLAFESLARYLFWDSCSRLYLMICQNGNGNVTNVNDIGSTNWQTSMRECIDRMTFPVDANTNLSSIRHKGGQFWMGVIRSYSIFTLSEALDKKESYLQGYIDTNWNLHFSSQNSPPKLRSLCMDFIPVPSSSPPRGTEMQTSPLFITTSAGYPISTRRSTPTSGGSKATQSDDSNGGIVAVYIVVPIVAIATAIVIGFVIWRRRKRHTKERAEPHEYVNSVQQTGIHGTNTDDVDLNKYETCRPVDNPEHQYSDLEQPRQTDTGTYINMDNTYQDQQSSTEHVYENK